MKYTLAILSNFYRIDGHGDGKMVIVFVNKH